VGGGVDRATVLHLLQFTSGREITLRLGAAAGPGFYPEARLADAGLFYEDASCQGTPQLDFLPMQNLLKPKARTGGARCNAPADERYEGFPTWSPDGSKLLFLSELPNAHAGEIDLVQADGSFLRRIGNATDADPLVDDLSAPRWSPDGRTILFQGAAYPGCICLVAATGGRVRQRSGRGSQPAWSPDGKKIAFLTSGALAIMNADGKDEHPLTENIRSHNFSWSPDSSSIVFLDNNFNMSIVNADGSQLHRLTTDNSAEEPAWSHDSHHLAYSGRDAIETINTDGSNKKTLTRCALPPASRFLCAGGPLDWSPNDTQITYIGWACAAKPCRTTARVWVVNANGTGQHLAHR